MGLGEEWGLGERLESSSENQGHLQSSSKMEATKDMDPEVEPSLVQIFISWMRTTSAQPIKPLPQGRFML